MCEDLRESQCSPAQGLLVLSSLKALVLLSLPLGPGTWAWLQPAPVGSAEGEGAWRRDAGSYQVSSGWLTARPVMERDACVGAQGFPS